MKIRHLINIKSIIPGLLFILLISTIHAQEFKGVLPSDIYIVPHRNNSLNLYDYGGNPAWMIKDEKINWFKIAPSFSNTGGDYRRQYDFGQADLYGIYFSGVKTLADGTFKGYAAYNLEERRNVYKSLKYDSYSGEAFFSTDSATGNFSYKGPSLGFTYSYELLPKLSIGASAGYLITEGLKKTYSRAQTIYRQASAGLGIAYEFSDHFILGCLVNLKDSQEKITSMGVDLEQVEIQNFRGETFFINDISNIISQKVKKQAFSLGSQAYFSLTNNFELGVKGEFSKNGTKILIPRSNVNLEDGYADERRIQVSLISRYHFSKELLTGVYSQYLQNKSWSKNSIQDMLLWEWEVNLLKAGGGASYYFNNSGLLLAAELEYSFTQADSNKYIDHRSAGLHSKSISGKLAAQFALSEDLFLTTGFNKGYFPVDMIAGGYNLTFNKMDIGFIKVYKNVQADLCISYFTRSPEAGGVRRSIFLMLELNYLYL